MNPGFNNFGYGFAQAVTAVLQWCSEAFRDIPWLGAVVVAIVAMSVVRVLLRLLMKG